jgi:21S rRNA (GM2251-2'-O)-methyltransferase
MRRPNLHKLYLQWGEEAEGAARAQRRVVGGVSLRDIEAAAREAGLPSSCIHRVDKHELNLLADQRPHNGVVLEADPLPVPEVGVLEDAAKELLQHEARNGIELLPVAEARRPELWVALDQLEDPQNLGAVLRSCYFFGVRGVILSQRNCAPLSPVTCKAASGAAEFLNVFACNSLPRFLARSREHSLLGGSAKPAPMATPAKIVKLADGTQYTTRTRPSHLRVLGLSVSDVLAAHPGAGTSGAEPGDVDAGVQATSSGSSGDAGARVPILSCHALPIFTPAERVLLVIGNEGRGLRTLVAQQCDTLVRIDGAASAADEGQVDSLNVSNALAVALFQLSRVAPEGTTVTSR